MRIISWLLVGWSDESHGVGVLSSWASLFLGGDWSFQCENQRCRMNLLMWKNISRFDGSSDLATVGC